MAFNNRSGYLYLFTLFLIVSLTGCTSNSDEINHKTTSPPPTATSTSYATHTPTIEPVPTSSPSPSPASTKKSTEVEEIKNLRICSPLQGIPITELTDTIHNPFNPPRSGRDDPHQGVDFAVLEYGIALSGNPVQSVLDGHVAAVIDNRFPYGNALMIETPLESLAPQFVSGIYLPTLSPTIEPHPALNCPQVSPVPSWNAEKRSLYLFYAHMKEPPSFQIDEVVECGQIIGQIGDSGNALNPHLHLEVRIGPSGARLGSMAHYHTSASPVEMSAYCTWRVREIFQLVDPKQLLPTTQ
jgi:murein DD-endopeptidase MepM/ murein hydrolase activator NlpD